MGEDLILVALKAYGIPGVLVVLVTFLLRKNIVAAFMGSDTEKAAEAVLKSIDASFRENLTYFKSAEKQMGDMLVVLRQIRDHQKDHLEIQHAIQAEVARQSGFLEGRR